MADYGGIDLDDVLSTYDRDAKRVKRLKHRPSHDVWLLSDDWKETVTKDGFWARFWCTLFHWSTDADFGDRVYRCGVCDRILD